MNRFADFFKPLKWCMAMVLTAVVAGCGGDDAGSGGGVTALPASSCPAAPIYGGEGSADYILAHDGMGQAAFAERIIAEGIARHRRAQKPYAMRGNAIAGYGIFATTDLEAGDVVFRGEGRAHRVVTARHVQAAWNADDQQTFRRYGYPLSDELYAWGDDDPGAWAPQNHSCAPNTAFAGLDVVATRAVASGEEFTLDYAEFMNEESEPFECRCGAPACRGTVWGTSGNSVTARENARQAAD